MTHINLKPVDDLAPKKRYKAKINKNTPAYIQKVLKNKHNKKVSLGIITQKMSVYTDHKELIEILCNIGTEYKTVTESIQESIPEYKPSHLGRTKSLHELSYKEAVEYCKKMNFHYKVSEMIINYIKNYRYL